MNIPEGEDGVTHINIYSKGKTFLGRWLTNFAHTEFEYKAIKFASLEAFWYWSLCNDPSLCKLYGHQAKIAGKEILKQKGIPQYFINEELIKEAIDIKLKTYPEKMRELAESTLKFTHYYEYGDKRVEAGYEWVTEHFELRRKQLKEYYNI